MKSPYIVLLSCWMMTAPAWAQTAAGTITDTSGAAVAGANFGRITTQANDPRQAQFGLKLIW